MIFVTSITSSACVKLSALRQEFHFVNLLLEQFMRKASLQVQNWDIFSNFSIRHAKLAYQGTENVMINAIFRVNFYMFENRRINFYMLENWPV